MASTPPNRQRRASRDLKADAARAVSPPRSSKLVLVVDDFRDNREMYAQFLTHFGWRVAEAADGQEALDKARASRPDIIVMDLSLPIMDGFEATRRLKADAETKTIPIVALTGFAMKDSEKLAFEAGADLFLTKPCLPDELEAQLERLLTEKNTRGSSAAA